MGRHFQFIRRTDRTVRLPCSRRECKGESTDSHRAPAAWRIPPIGYGGPSDISLTNASAPILTPAEQLGILAASNRLLTPDSLAQAFAAKTNYDRVKHLLTLQTNATYDVVPAAFSDGGRPKYNINELATNPFEWRDRGNSRQPDLGNHLLEPEFFFLPRSELARRRGKRDTVSSTPCRWSR